MRKTNTFWNCIIVLVACLTDLIKIDSVGYVLNDSSVICLDRNKRKIANHTFLTVLFTTLIKYFSTITTYVYHSNLMFEIMLKYIYLNKLLC